MEHPIMAIPREVCPGAISLIQEYEGIPKSPDGHAMPYPDPIGVWTIGWGHAIQSGGRFLCGPADLPHVKALYPDGISFDQALAMLKVDLMQTGTGILAIVNVTLTDNQYGALSSFAFNLGLGNLKKSTLLKLLNQGDVKGAAEQFPLWCNANGKPLTGLLNRRNAERSLFLLA
jgi:lysozyme